VRHVVVPQHEPEVVAAGAAKDWRGKERVATTALTVLTVHGVELSSQWNKAEELRAMAKMVDGLHPRLLAKVESIWCNSSACAAYIVMLRECSKREATWVVDGFEHVCRGHNGISFLGKSGGSLFLDVNWPGEALG
jgi:hypothetical protein